MRHERIHLQWLKKGENNCRVMQIVCPLTTKNLLQTQFFSNAPRCFVACNHIGCGYMLHISRISAGENQLTFLAFQAGLRKPKDQWEVL